MKLMVESGFKDEDVGVCHTSEGIAKHTTCTTTAYFETWIDIPRTRGQLMVLIGRADNDFAILRKAFHLANACKFIDVPVIGMKVKSIPDVLTSHFWLRMGRVEPNFVSPIQSCTDANNALLKKKCVHKRIRQLETWAKVIHSSREVVNTRNASDASIDVVSHTFLDSCRSQIKKSRSELGELEKLTESFSSLQLNKRMLDGEGVSRIARRNIIDEEKLFTFVRSIGPQSIEWSDVRRRIRNEFELP
ncbi:hypothetical protein PFISCL1PPCAC_23527 [Pristionchus fissidentatus]|uniref:Ribosomal protein n=1 Tax=Pristionchus fissidentatus TaxID=1538716 RepID=A0AAV5WNR0_9BILA|nr:hypothetical protein PFISCL1PPCAC_23527 [Pristionchus fissidentatus]